MTRRAFLLAIPASAAIAGSSSPRNDLCVSANQFHEPYRTWAEKMNASKEHPGTIPADAVQAFEPLPKLWRNVEHSFKTWVRGF